MSYILSWYETIEFDLVQTCRTASKFVSEDQWIEQHKELVNFFTERADLHTFIPNLPFQVAPAAGGEEAEGEADEEEEEGNAADDKDGESEADGDAEATPQTETAASGPGTTADTEAPSA